MTIRTQLVCNAPRLCVDDCGEGELLLFLHGIGGRRQNWRSQLEHFSGRFHAMAWDGRGYGDSDDYEGPLAFTDFADDVVRLLDCLQVEQAHLCGLSMGGRIALAFWSRYPERVITLTLADTSAGSKETQDPARIEAFLGARQKPLLEGRTPAELAPQLADQLLGASTSAEARSELITSLSQLHVESYIKTLEAATRFTDFPNFAEISVPVQVIVGSEDRIAPPQVAKAMADAIPGARFNVIQGAGHVSNVERPHEFNTILEHFLTTQAKGGRV